MAIIQLEDLSRHYGEDETLVKALDSVSISIEKGEIVALLGPSGSGKTTLLNTIAALDVPLEGTYLFEGEEVPLGHVEKMTTFRRENIGYIFQFFNLLADLTALENVLLVQDLSGSRNKDKALELLDSVGLSLVELSTPKGFALASLRLSESRYEVSTTSNSGNPVLLSFQLYFLHIKQLTIREKQFITPML